MPLFPITATKTPKTLTHASTKLINTITVDVIQCAFINGGTSMTAVCVVSNEGASAVDVSLALLCPNAITQGAARRQRIAPHQSVQLCASATITAKHVLRVHSVNLRVVVHGMSCLICSKSYWLFLISPHRSIEFAQGCCKWHHYSINSLSASRNSILVSSPPEPRAFALVF
jgi:hypothetical protein